MTCRTLFALFSAAMVWNLPHNILAQATQGNSEQTPGVATSPKDTNSDDSSVLQMQAKKPPAKPKAKAKKVKPPAKAAKGKAPAKAKAKSAPKPAPKPAAPPAPKVQPKPYTPPPKPKPAPFFPPAPPEDMLDEQTIPVDDSRFQVPLPEDKGFFNIWGDNSSSTPDDPTTVNNQFGLVAVGNYLGAGFGFEYQRRSLSWMDWGFQVTTTSARLGETRNPDTDEFLNSQLVSLKGGARFFNNRWIYLSTNLALNSVQGQYGWKGPGVTDNEITSDFKAQMIQLDLALGSQWEPGKGFYIGVDWLGLGVPLVNAIKYDTNQDLDDLTRVLTGSTADERIRKELGAQFLPYYVLLKFGYML